MDGQLMRALLLSMLLVLHANAQMLQLNVNGGSAAQLPPVVPSFAAACTGTPGSLSSDCTVSPASVQGHALIAFSRTQNNTGTAVPNFTTLSGPVCNSSDGSWQKLYPTIPNDSNNPFDTAIWYCILTSSGTEHVQVSWTGQSGSQFTDLRVYEGATTGVWNTPLFDRIALSSNTSGTTCTSGQTGLRTSNPIDLLIGDCETFNAAETWPAVAGWTNRPAASRNTAGIYDAATNTSGIQSITVPLPSADSSRGILLAIQATNNANCANCTYVQTVNSARSGEITDAPSILNLVPGNAMVYMQYHTNFSGHGTTTISDSWQNKWHPCDYPSRDGSDPNTFTDLPWNGGTMGMSCFYTLALTNNSTNFNTNVDVITPIATDCAATCTQVGGWLAELSGPTQQDSFAASTDATSGSDSNNVSCGALVTSKPNDLILCNALAASGTFTAGTVPTNFTINVSTNGSGEYGVWSGSGATQATQTLSGAGIPYGALSVAFK